VAIILIERPDSFLLGIHTQFKGPGGLFAGILHHAWVGIIAAGIERKGIYVECGAIIPTQAVVQNTGEKPAGPLELRVYAGEKLSGLALSR